MKSTTNHHRSTINLPQNFQFSQGSLQAYVDCPRLFQLRYVERLSWPAPEVEPAIENERYMQLGSDFHRLVQQCLLGVPAERVAKLAAQDARLSQWWRNFQEAGPDLSGYAHHEEVTLSAAVGGQRVVAKYDLVAVHPPSPQPSPEGRGSDSPLPSGEGLGVREKIIIYDWKTSRKQPKREWQEKKLQTQVYPYLLVRAGSHLNNGKSIRPEQIEMVYWFSNFPTAPMKFAYSQERFEADEGYLTDLIEELKTFGEDEAPKTENEKRCRFCVYRSLCNRGVKAGSLDDLEESFEAQDGFEFELDFEQIAEIEF